MESCKKTKFDRVLSILLRIYLIAFACLALHYGRRIFIAEQFVIPSESMAPTLVAGDKVWVNKLLLGGRIYKSFDFDEHAPLKCFRMPGLREVRYGDVICFNYPHGCGNEWKIEFKINYVFCKRVLGSPGDRIGAVDGHYWNDRILKPLGVLDNQERLRWMFDGLFMWNNSYDVFPESGTGWNIKNWGPLTVPAKGLTVSLDEHTRELYRQVIEFETGKRLGENIDEYTFTGNYYFAVGDNVPNSNDSRKWGFIPEDYIIGVVGGKKVKNNPNKEYVYEESIIQ